MVHYKKLISSTCSRWTKELLNMESVISARIQLIIYFENVMHWRALDMNTYGITFLNQKISMTSTVGLCTRLW